MFKFSKFLLRNSWKSFLLRQQFLLMIFPPLTLKNIFIELFLTDCITEGAKISTRTIRLESSSTRTLYQELV